MSQNGSQADSFGDVERTESEGRAGADPRARAADDDLMLFLDAEPQILELSDRDYDALLDAIANPPAPNDVMRRAVARWREIPRTPSVDDGAE